MNMSDANYRNFVEKELKFNTTEGDLLYYYNEFCDYNNYVDDFVYTNDEDFFSNMFSSTWQAVVAVSNSDTYNIKDNFVMLSADGDTAISYDNIWDAMGDPDSFIDYMCEKQKYIDLFEEENE